MGRDLDSRHQRNLLLGSRPVRWRQLQNRPRPPVGGSATSFAGNLNRNIGFYLVAADGGKYSTESSGNVSPDSGAQHFALFAANPGASITDDWLGVEDLFLLIGAGLLSVGALLRSRLPS